MVMLSVRYKDGLRDSWHLNEYAADSLAKDLINSILDKIESLHWKNYEKDFHYYVEGGKACR